jgi:hypothetical protein
MPRVPLTATVDMDFERDCKHSVVYSAEPRDGPTGKIAQALTSIYVNRTLATLEGRAPAAMPGKIRVTITEILEA